MPEAEADRVFDAVRVEELAVVAVVVDVRVCEELRFWVAEDDLDIEIVIVEVNEAVCVSDTVWESVPC